ncbi:MAG: creatininase family protein [Bacteroidetes bacterium]|nr:creatininase family protein [Bacteroidota bacterium]
MRIPNPPRPYILAETNWKAIQKTKFEVAVLPWGATEAHNYHLPYATDNFQNEAITEPAAKLAWERGAKVIVLPNIPFGVQTGQLDIPLCMNVLPSTQLAILKDVCDVLVRAGIPKLVIFNGHGGNDFKMMVRELSFHFPQLFACTLNWFKTENKSGYFTHLDGDHADEMETSLMLEIQPSLVLPLEEAGDGFVKKWKFKAMQEGWVNAQRAWTRASKDTGAGNPYESRAENGRRYLEAVVSKVSDFFVDLAETPVESFMIEE